MRSKYAVAFTAIFILAFCVNVYAIQVSVPEISADPGSTITVAINVDNATGIAGGNIVLEYDSAILVAKEARMTDLAQSLTLVANTDVEDKVILAMAGASGLDEGSVAIIEVDFDVKADATGESPLTLSDVTLFDEMGINITVETANGKVTVKTETPTKKYPAWDVNDDGVVNIFDLVLVGTHFGEDYRAEGPVVVMHLCLPTTKIGTSSGKEANVWIEAQNKVGAESMRLLLVDINVEPVSDLYGCQFDLAFDPKVLEVVGVKDGDILAQDGASTYWNVSKIDNQRGRIVDAIYVRKATKKGISDGGTLSTVVFKVKDVSISDSTRLNLTNIVLADVDARMINAVIERTLLRWEDLLIPEKSMLLQNYPNPFNPETWIPFYLAAPANVVISIYDVGGQLIRKIRLGKMSAGIYISRDKAVYWDGRNHVGEKISSGGVYFYHLQAGDYSATKRMLILK